MIRESKDLFLDLLWEKDSLDVLEGHHLEHLVTLPRSLFNSSSFLMASRRFLGTIRAITTAK